MWITSRKYFPEIDANLVYINIPYVKNLIIVPSPLRQNRPRKITMTNYYDYHLDQMKQILDLQSKAPGLDSITNLHVRLSNINWYKLTYTDSKRVVNQVFKASTLLICILISWNTSMCRLFFKRAWKSAPGFLSLLRNLSQFLETHRTNYKLHDRADLFKH